MTTNIAKNSNIKTCKELLLDFEQVQKSLRKGELLSFSLGDREKFCFNYNFPDDDITIYNPTKPFIRHGKKYLIGRVEPKGTEDSKVMFFEKIGAEWQVVPNAPVFHLQDPFMVDNVQGWNVVGGVKLFAQKEGFYKFQTHFYRFKKCNSELIKEDKTLVEPFAVGPMQMKDIRLLELKNGNVGVFTRPSGGEFGGGKIGFIEIDSLDKLEEAIPKAKIIEGQFSKGEWGGTNELHLLANGKIGVLGHVAHFEGPIRHYYAMSFVFDPSNFSATPINILTSADQFPEVPSKRTDLGKIIFSGGLERKIDGTASLYVGVGDVKAGKIKISDPFLKYELSNI